jgi:hypothetical protein
MQEQRGGVKIIPLAQIRQLEQPNPMRVFITLKRFIEGAFSRSR